MRIRRTILARTVLARAILAIGAIGALVTGPVLALATVGVPAGTAVAVGANPDAIVMHG